MGLVPERQLVDVSLTHQYFSPSLPGRGGRGGREREREKRKRERQALARWLSWLEHHPILLSTKRLRVQSLLGARMGGSQSMFLSHTDVFLSLPSPYSLSKSVNLFLKNSKRKYRIQAFLMQEKGETGGAEVRK